MKIKKKKLSNELIMDISVEKQHQGMYVYINIKDRVKGKSYIMRSKEDINKSCDIATMFIEKFKIKEVHIDTVGIGQALYDCLLYNLKKHNVNWCDVIKFTPIALGINTKIDVYDNKLYFH